MRYYAKYAAVHGFAQITELSDKSILTVRSFLTKLEKWDFIRESQSRIKSHKGLGIVQGH